jgi:AraC-like DNA-binding protein/quercetin dioxygenase-like cupin family protein
MYDLILLDLYGSCLGNQVKYQVSENVVTIQSSCILENDVTETHSHSRGQLLYLLSGNLIVVAEDRSYVIYPGNYVWIPPHLKHKTISRTRSELHSLYIDANTSKSLSSTLCIMKASSLFCALISSYKVLSQQTPSNKTALDNMVSLLLLEITNGNSMPVGLPLPQDKRLLNLCKKLFEDPLCQKTIAELLLDIPISYRHAIRLFKAQTGIDFGKWRAFLKLHISVSLLMSGYSVGQVSDEVGYSNPSGFSAAFKNEFGVSPKEFLITSQFKDSPDKFNFLV